MYPACSVLAPISSRCRFKAGKLRQSRDGPGKGPSYFLACLRNLYQGCTDKASNNVPMCYGRKSRGMDAKLPKEDCNDKLPNRGGPAYFALTKAVPPLSCRYKHPCELTKTQIRSLIIPTYSLQHCPPAQPFGIAPYTPQCVRPGLEGVPYPKASITEAEQRKTPGAP
jgi:hypothetical protein